GSLFSPKTQQSRCVQAGLPIGVKGIGPLEKAIAARFRTTKIGLRRRVRGVGQAALPNLTKLHPKESGGRIARRRQPLVGRQATAAPLGPGGICPGVCERVGASSGQVPFCGFTHPAPEVLIREVLWRLLDIGLVEQRRGLGRDPTPTHGVLPEIATYPAVGSNGVIGLSIDCLPYPVLV